MNRNVLIGLGFCAGVALAQFLPNFELAVPIAAVVGSAIAVVIGRAIYRKKQREIVIKHRLESINEQLSGEFNLRATGVFEPRHRHQPPSGTKSKPNSGISQALP